VRRRAYRWLVIAAVVALLGVADGSASSKEFNYNIVAIDLAGRQTNLTYDSAMNVNPAVAPDGRIAFLSTRDGSPDLYVMDGNGGNVRRLTNGAGIALGEDLEWSQASWSPREDRIAFDAEYGVGGPDCMRACVNWDVLTIGSDGSGLNRVALEARTPAWSPGARRLAYESGVIRLDFIAEGVTITRLGGSGSVQLKSFNRESDAGPLWSPTGRQLVFQAQRTDGAPTWIYTVRADGTHKRRLAAGHNPVWSPDGRRLAFIENYKLITISKSGKDRRRLSRKGEYVIAEAWSPKGEALAYIAGTKYQPGGFPMNLRLETVSPDGKRVRVLARESASLLFWGSPAWMPRGKRILLVEYH
jgi:Tol biopolymer transport system component